MPVSPLLGASQKIPGLMKNQNAQYLGAAFNPPVVDALGRAMDYGAGAPVNIGTAKQRGLAGVAGGLVDNLTFGATDFDKRGDSKRQKDTKEFLNKFIFGTQGDIARKTRDEMKGGAITAFNDTGFEPGAKFGYTFNVPNPF